MLSQQPQHLRFTPPLRNRAIRSPECTNSLRPLATLGSSLLPGLRQLVLGRRVFSGNIRWVLGGPIVDVPVVLIKKAVIFLELLDGHVPEIDVGEGGKKQVGFEDTTLTALVYLDAVSVRFEVYMPAALCQGALIWEMGTNIITERAWS